MKPGYGLVLLFMKFFIANFNNVNAESQRFQ